MLSLSKLIGVACLFSQAQALYFYIEVGAQKCFFEELPKDTLVVGNYKATSYDSHSKSYLPNTGMSIQIYVDERFDNDHRVVSQRGASSGKFTFTAADSGEHRICFLPTGVPETGGFLFSGHAVGGIKLELDLAIGASSEIKSATHDKMGEIVQRVKDLNSRLQDIRREQIFQRQREADFRDQSEAVNARVVRWTLIQLVVLAATCAWQLSYLRAFFIKQKLT